MSRSDGGLMVPPPPPSPTRRTQEVKFLAESTKAQSNKLHIKITQTITDAVNDLR
jgi:hypothetical protein